MLFAIGIFFLFIAVSMGSMEAIFTIDISEVPESQLNIARYSAWMMFVAFCLLAGVIE